MVAAASFLAEQVVNRTGFAFAPCQRHEESGTRLARDRLGISTHELANLARKVEGRLDQLERSAVVL
jgi:hypothetical protein